MEPQEAARCRLAHADRVREAQCGSGGGKLDRRDAQLRSRTRQALYLVELSLARLGRRGQGPPPRSHLGQAGARRPGLGHDDRETGARLAAAIGPRPGSRHDRAVRMRRRLRASMSEVGEPRAPEYRGSWSWIPGTLAALASRDDPFG